MSNVPHITCDYYRQVQISLCGLPFSSYMPFWDKCTEWPQNDLEYWKVKGTRYAYHKRPRVPNCTMLRSTASHFRVTGRFETSASNDPKMTLNTDRSKSAPYTCCNYQRVINVTPVRSIPNSFPVTSHSESVHQMTSKWRWTINVQRYHIYMLQLSASPGFHCFSLYT